MTLYTYKEVEIFIKQIKHQIKNSTIDPKHMQDFFNNKKCISIIK